MEKMKNLYRVNDVVNSSEIEPVWITENEKHAGMLNKIGVQATTSGLHVPPDAVSWNPLEGRKVIIWPIETEVSAKSNHFVREVAHILHQLNCLIKAVDISQLKSTDATDTTDAINWMFAHDGMNKEDLMDLPLVSIKIDNIKKGEKTNMNTGQSLQKASQGNSQSQSLIELLEDFEFFHSPDMKPFVSVPFSNHSETHYLKSRDFQNLIKGKYYKTLKGAINKNALDDALGVLESKALFDGMEKKVHVRIAGEDYKSIYIDLGDKLWSTAKVAPDYWEITQNSSVKFIRPKGIQEFPVPTRGGSLDDLRPFINLPDENSWVLLVSYILYSLTPKGPFPILLVQGEQGASKSTFCKVIRSLIDPVTPPLRSMPSNNRDLMVAAQNGWLLVYDNISRLSPDMSDALCRLSTGGGYAIRQLYTDDNEMIIEASCPVCLNGITEFAVRDDLLDRAMILRLPSIPDNKRKDENSFWEEFKSAYSGILGGLLDVLSSALKYLPEVEIEEKPRMADFAKFSIAVERAMCWDRNTFMNAYNVNRMNSVEMTLDSNPVTHAIIHLDQKEWKGTATALLETLSNEVSETVRRSRAWPSSGRWLSSTIKESAPALRRIGIEVDTGREGSSGTRVINIRKTDKFIVSSARFINPLEKQGFLDDELDNLMNKNNDDDEDF